MDYKTILTAVTKADPTTLQPVIDFAIAHDAHLDVLCFGIDHAYPAYFYGSANLDLMQASQDTARSEAMELRSTASKALEAAGASGDVHPVVSGLGGIGDILGSRGRLADLAILAQPAEDERPRLQDMVVEATLFAAALPVLLMPHGKTLAAWPTRVVAGWDGGPQALAALRAAMPLLYRAETVEIVIVDPPRHSPDQPDPGEDIARMLSRHGVSVEVEVMARTMPRISDIMLRHAADTGAELIVMGAYGHSRFQETVFGGTTRRMLSEAKVPLMLAH